jgi:hypothetical protein
MKYKFFNMGGKLLWELDEPTAVGNDTETNMGIQKLFANFPSPPPEEAICKVGRTHDGKEQWSVGPFDVLVSKEK